VRALKPLKSVAKLLVSNVDKKTVEGEVEVLLCNYVDVYYNNRISESLSFMEATATPSQISIFGLRKDDVLFTKDSETADDIAVSAYVPVDVPGVVCGYHLAIARPREGVIDGRYLYWALCSQFAREQFYVAATGVTRFGLRQDEMRSVKLPVHDLSMQRTIADYLDTETARIDALIDKNQRMIELLRERIDAAIREEVLGSGHSEGLPWAYAMGRDRVLTRLGSVLRLRQERNDPIRLRQVLSLTAARGVIPYEEKGDIGNKASEDISRYSIVRVGDIVLNSMNVIIGSVGLSKYEGVLSPVYYVMTPLDAELVDRRFLAYHFRIREFQRQLIRLGYGILEHRLRIPWVNLKSQELALPPLVEQRRVVDSLDAMEAKHLLLATRLNRQIDLLRERRQALITAAVTGELEIPGVAA